MTSNPIDDIDEVDPFPLSKRDHANLCAEEDFVRDFDRERLCGDSNNRVGLALAHGFSAGVKFAQPEWRDISTAPKDKCILISDGSYVTEGRWIGTPDDDGHIGWCEAGFQFGGGLFECHYEAEPSPTKWTPLPKSPS